MKTLNKIREAIYILKPKKVEKKDKQLIEDIKEITEPTAQEVNPNSLSILVNDSKFIDGVKKIKVLIDMDSFKKLFGKKSKPRKGDILTIGGLTKSFMVKERGKRKNPKNKKSKVFYELKLKSTKE